MASYTLSGEGTQLLSSETSLLFIQATPGAIAVTWGRANPANYYGIGLLRQMQSGYCLPAQPIDALQMLVPLAAGTDTLGYSIFGDGSIVVTENTAPPPPGLTYQLFADSYDPPDPPTNSFGGITLGFNWTVTATGLSILAFRYWLPSVADYSTVPYAFWDVSTTTLLMNDTTPTLTAGWNTVPITPVSINDTDTYQVICIPQGSGYRGQEIGILSGLTNGPLVAGDQCYDFNAVTYGPAGSTTGPDWDGMDLIVG
jgi:hypothetical protein